MLGEVIRIFREQPVLTAIAVGGEQVRLQVVFSPVTDEQINQVWSTQGDATYRPSVIYEMVLAPIIPSQQRIEPPLVGALGNQAFASMAQRHAGFGTTQVLGAISPSGYQQSAMGAGTLLALPKRLRYSLSFDVNSPIRGFIPRVGGR